MTLLFSFVKLIKVVFVCLLLITKLVNKDYHYDLLLLFYITYHIISYFRRQTTIQLQSRAAGDLIYVIVIYIIANKRACLMYWWRD